MYTAPENMVLLLLPLTEPEMVFANHSNSIMVDYTDGKELTKKEFTPSIIGSVVWFKTLKITDLNDGASGNKLITVFQAGEILKKFQITHIHTNSITIKKYIYFYVFSP